MTTAPILDPIAGGCWARCRLRSGIMDTSVASRLMKSLTLVRIAFIDTLAIPELDGRFLHDRWANSVSDCGRLLGSMPASQSCKVYPTANFIHEVTGLSGVLAIPELDGGFLHHHCSDPGPDCRRLLGSTPATQWYKWPHYRMRTHEIADHYKGCLYRSPGAHRALCQIPPRLQGRS